MPTPVAIISHIYYHSTIMQAALGMFGYVTDLKTVQEADSIAIEVEGTVCRWRTNHPTQ